MYDGHIYFVCAQVIPSEWGTARKPWFFLTKNYWCSGSSKAAVSDDTRKVLEHFESEGRDSVEPVDHELRGQVAAGECVAIRGEPASRCRPQHEVDVDARG